MSILPGPLNEDIYNNKPGHAAIHVEERDLINAIRDLVVSGRLSEIVMDGTYASVDSVGEYVMEHAEEIAEAAALHAATDAGLVLKTDPGIPTVDSIANLAVATMVGASKPFGRTGENVIDRTGNVPAWVLNRWAARMGSFASSLAPVDIWLILGQSNSIRRPPATEDPLASPTPWIVTQNYADHNWYTEGTTTACGPWLGSGVARAWWERDARAVGRRVGTIEAGIGGTGFTPVELPAASGIDFTWDQADTTSERNLAEEARDWALEALAASPAGSRIVGVVWSQGEADRGYLDEAAYGAKLDSLIGWFRTELGIADLPWICTPMTPQLHILGPEEDTLEILHALEDTPRRVEYTAYTLHAPDDATPDNYIHWSPDAQHRRGAAIITDPDPLRASAWDQAVNNFAAAPARQTPGLDITRSGNEATITWGHPPSRVQEFILETSVNSGVDWDVETLTALTTHRHTMTVAAGTPLWARITTECESGFAYTTLEVRR